MTTETYLIGYVMKLNCGSSFRSAGNTGVCSPSARTNPARAAASSNRTFTLESADDSRPTQNVNRASQSVPRPR